MNSFDNNTSINELEPGADRAMDGLLQEYAHRKSGDDESFLLSLEAALDASAKTESQPVQKSNRIWKWGLLGSAAACVGFGLLVWNRQQLILEAPPRAETTKLATLTPQEAIPEFANRRRDHYVGPNPDLPLPTPDQTLPEIHSVVGNSNQTSISGFALPVDGGANASAGGGLMGNGFGAGKGPGMYRDAVGNTWTRSQTLAQVDELRDYTAPESPDVSAGIPGTGYGGLMGSGVGGGEGVGRGRGGGAYTGYGKGTITKSGAGTLTLSGSSQGGREFSRGVGPGTGVGFVPMDGESYSDSTSSDKYSSSPENAFLSPLKSPLSTFSVDVDTASYANLRRMIQSGQSVPPAAVRIEEMVNYFTYSYPQLEGPHPFSVQVESAACPWNEAHRLVKIGLKAKDIVKEKRPSANLVFLCDVSGSMSSVDKLELLVKNLTVLTNELNADDTVGIVVYAGNEGVALPPTSGGNKETILKALNNLSAGGSTNGGAGITRAYQMAQERFIKGGINRVVLCTDGDFNVGTTSREALVNLVEENAKSGVFLTVCGYGQGNLNDSMMEAITNKGNGVYLYVDSEKEGKKIFKDELFGTLMTAAKDVKLQVEFNPAKVGQYRLVGYDNRMLKKEDFANDKVDAGDIGAGHTVTALYEIIPPGVAAQEEAADRLKYQTTNNPDSPVSSGVPEESRDGDWVIKKYPDGHFRKTKTDTEKKQTICEHYDRNQKMTKREVFKLDENGHLRNGVITDANGNAVGAVEFGYDANNQISEKREFDAKGQLVNRSFPAGSLTKNPESAKRDDEDEAVRVEPTSGEMLTVKLRYKEPEGTESKLLEVPHSDAGQSLAGASSDFKFASVVAEFGEWLRGKRVPGRTLLQFAEQAESARGNDPHGLRSEFIELIKASSGQQR